MRENIFTLLLTVTIVLGAFASTGMVMAQNSDETMIQENWMVILYSFPKSQLAIVEQKVEALKQQGYAAHYIDTNDYSNLKNDLWAVVMGPYAQKEAREMKTKLSALVSDCYIKSVTQVSKAPASSFFSCYTTLKWDDCKTIDFSEWEPEPEIDYFTQECPAFEGYQIFHKGADSRSWLIIKKGDLAFDFHDAVTQKASGHFPAISENPLEWRYHKQEEAIQLCALIFEVISQDADDYQKSISQWFVLRVDNDQICLLGTYASQNKARSIAESNLKCLR